MATDTAPSPALQAPAPAPPAPPAGPPPAPQPTPPSPPPSRASGTPVGGTRTPETIDRLSNRRALATAYRKPAAEPVSSLPETSVQSGQTEAPSDAAPVAAPAEPTPPPQAPPAPSTEGAPPTDDQAPPPEPSPVAAQAQTPVPTPEPEKPAPAPPARPPLPQEFQDEIAALAPRAPLLKRTLARLWNDPTLSDVGKIQKMTEKVIEARTAPVQPTSEQRRYTLAQEGQLEELREATLQESEAQRQQAQAFGLASAIIADYLELDPEDPEYLAASSVQELATLAEQRSPRLQAVVTKALDDLKATHEKAMQAQKAELDRHWKAELETAVNQATARLDGGRPAPPRIGPSGIETTAGANPLPPRDASDAARMIRGTLAGAYRQADRARRQAEMTGVALPRQ